MKSPDDLFNVLAAYFQQHDEEKFNKKLAELRASIESAITRSESKIMATIKEQLDAFATDVETKFGEIGGSVDGLVNSVAGLTGDIASLKKKIDDLMNSGDLDQATKDRLAAIQSAVAGLSVRTKAVADAAAALDSQTEETPTPPA